MKAKFILLLLVTINAFSTAQPVIKLKATDDFQLSSYTGYTRAHWIEITEQIIAGALLYKEKNTK